MAVALFPVTDRSVLKAKSAEKIKFRNFRVAAEYPDRNFVIS